MLAAQGILTSFRSVSTLIGVEVAGTSGSNSFIRESLSTACWRKLAQYSTGYSKAATQAHAAFASQSASQAASSTGTQLACAMQITAQSPRLLSSSHASWQCRGWSFAAGGHRSFKTHATARSMWQRDYYKSGYSRGYGNYWDGDKVLYGLIAANVAGFFLWQSHPGLMRQQATVSINSVREGRIHTLLTSAFSHASLSHLFANMFTFYFFGRDIGTTFGGKRLLGLYVAAGIAGSLAHVVFCYFQAQSTGAAPWIKEVRMANSPPALGASAAVNGIMTLSTLLYPRRGPDP